MELFPRLSVLDIEALSDPSQVWTDLVEKAPDAWFWSTSSCAAYHLEAARKADARNLSFIVALDGIPVGLALLLVERSAAGDGASWNASYYGGPLPWPSLLPNLPQLAEIEDFTFAELERRAHEAGAGRIRFRLSPPHGYEGGAERFSRIVLSRRYLDISYPSHWIDLGRDTLSGVRERYRRYYKKFAPSYDLLIFEGPRVDAALEETYFKLHVKDAGGQHRSRESYHLQADLARKGEAFYVAARHRGHGAIVGMLLVSVYKGSAYDNSVGVDPDYQGEYVSHLLKWKAIETLISRDVKTYELGEQASLPTWTGIPTSKNRGISHFKDGWARGNTRTIFASEKFLCTDMLGSHMRRKASALENYFKLREDDI